MSLKIAHGGKQLARGNCRSAKLPHNHAGSGVSEHRGVANRNTGCDRKRKHCKPRIASAGYVEYLASGRGAIDSRLSHTRVADLTARRGNMKAFLRSLFKYVKTFGASSDDSNRASKMCTQSASRIFDRIIASKRGINKKSCLLRIANNQVRAAVREL